MNGKNKHLRGHLLLKQMPQLDLFTFPTQIYGIALFFFLALLFFSTILTRLFFCAELFEQEKQFLRGACRLRLAETAYVQGSFGRLGRALHNLFLSVGVVR